MTALAEIARALRGRVVAGQVLAPGPGHSPSDRSLAVRPSIDSPTGWIAFSHAGDDWRACRDYVAAALGQTPLIGAHRLPPPEATQPAGCRSCRAVALWQETQRPLGTPVERFLASRALDLSEGIPDALRFHPRCPWRDGNGELIYVPAMVAALRSIATDEITGVHRTALTPEGVKIDRRMLGVAGGSAIKLDADEDVTYGLTIGEGIETTLAGRQLGFRPAWALGSVGAIVAFPVLAGIDCLTILAERGDASERAVTACADRWHTAGREVLLVEPRFGSDVNDALVEALT